MPNLQPVPEAGPYRDGVYLRVSAVMGREDERFLSPDLQRTAIDRARRAAPGPSVVVGEFKDIDVSGRSMARDGLDEALAVARSGGMDRLWVLNLSRWARATREGLAELEAIERAGCRVMSTAEQIDLDSPTGYFSATVHLAVAKLHSDQIGEGWRKVHEWRVSQGKTPTGKPKWGYVWDKNKSVHEVDSATAPVLEALYRRYVSGESVYAMVRWLNEHGHRTLNGNPWIARTLRRVMDSGFAAGFVPFHGELHEGVHEPVIDRDLWQRYLDARAERRVRPPRTERSQYVYSGLVRHSCGSSMVAGQYGAGRVPKYRCKKGAESSGTQCPGGYVMSSTIEAEVLDWLREVADEVDAAAAAVLAQETRRTVATSERERLQREIDRIDRSMVKLTVQLNEDVISERAYRGTRVEYEEKRAGLEKALEALGREERRSRGDAPAVARKLLETWAIQPVGQRRETLRQLIARIEVRSGRPRSTVRIVPTWDEGL